MKLLASGTDQGVTYAVSGSNLVSGFDIVSIDVDGQTVPPTRVGEFATEAEAIAAAVARGKAFREARNGG